MRIAWLWCLSLVVVAGTASTLTRAQTQRLEPRVLSGGDIGFRVEGVDVSGRPTGSLVIRVNGEWREVGADYKVSPAK